MFEKKFGLPEARSLAGAGPEVSLPTVKATLKVLGVVNVVGKQVEMLVASADGAIKAAAELTAEIQAEDQVDEEGTSTTLIRLQDDRKNRYEINASRIRRTKQRITDLNAEIAKLRELAKKFA